MPWDARAILGLFIGWIVLTQVRSLFQLWPGVSVWYPPAALLAAACIIWGSRAVIPVFAAALVFAARYAGPADPLWRVVTISLTLKLVYAVAAIVLRRLGFDPAFSRVRDVSNFAGVMAIAALVAASFGTLDAMADGSVTAELAPRALLIFWLGDVVAVLALTPAMLAAALWWARRPLRAHDGLMRAAWPQSQAARRTSVRHDIVLAASVPVVLWLAFGFAPQLGFVAYVVCFIPLGWTALTHGVRGAATLTAVLDVGAIVLLHTSGVLPRDNLEMQTFIASLAVTGLFLGSVADERERGRVLLAQSEKRYRALIDLLPDPLVVHRGGKVLFANATAARTFGVASPSAMIGLRLADLADTSSQALVSRRVERLDSGEALEVAEHRFRRLDGSGRHIDLEASSTPIPYGDGEAALTVARDITERKRLEDELRHAQRMESVGRLAGGVAHDFNNLLTIIISYGQLLLAELQPGAIAREYAQETLEAAARAAALTRQLLTFSRKQVLQPKPVQLNAVVEATEKLLRRLLGPDVAITVTLGADTGVVVADPTQLDQVLVNLAVNARDAMPNGGSLEIETARVDAAPGDARWPTLAPGRYAMLAVRDTGSGMDEAVRARIFDPFFTTKEASRGTGLGLATVYGIVTQAGGSIFVETAVGAGTRFVVLFPAKSTAEEQRAPAVAVTAPRHPPSSGARVLLAEDDEHVRTATHRMLAAAGYIVTDSADGRAALEAYDRADARIDVIVTDMSMPGMNGRELARALRARGDAVPIVMVSGFVDPLDDLEIAGLSLLQKPLDGDTLIAAVEAALDSR
ncbi:MAG TPA: ATP-binding protein [Gemmatimonadaceae bacterium]|nr:ATP-binding protein [Gemmatimonadaceae bacterium]